MASGTGAAARRGGRGWGSVAGLAARLPRAVTIVDTRNLLDPVLVREAGLEYDGVGRR